MVGEAAEAIGGSCTSEDGGGEDGSSDPVKPTMAGWDDDVGILC
jgi:hypothetical protein